MSWLTRAHNLLRPNRVSDEINREMSFHVAERVDELVESGMSRAEAEREAARRFGHRTTLKETTRDEDMLMWLESLAGDVKLATRTLRSSPAFTLVAVLSLALGIGANTAIFSLINAVMLKSLPVHEPEALVTISSARFGSELSNPIWESFRDKQQVLRNVAVFSSAGFTLSDGGEARRVTGNWVSGDYFNTLGVTPVAGRLLTRLDDVRGCAPTVVLSYGFWQSEFGGQTSAIGSAIALNKQPFTIVGVTPPEFFGAIIGSKQQFYVPLCATAAVGQGEMLDEKRGWFLFMIGRLKPDQTVERAQQELSLITEAVLTDGLLPDQLDDVRKEPGKHGFLLESGVGALSAVRDQYSTALYVLMAVVGLVLVIGCANVANLLLARAAVRQREIAVRFALGASRLRVVRQLLTETFLIAALGAALGVLFAQWSTSLIIKLLDSSRSPVTMDVPIDGSVLLFTIGVASLTALLFGLAPAWQSTRANPEMAMRANGRGIAPGHSRFSVAKALVVGQVAVSLMLVVGAGLLLGTFRTLSNLNLGFDRENVLLVAADFGERAENPLHTTELEFQERLRTLVGVSAVSASSSTPVARGGWNQGITAEGFVSKTRGDALAYLTQVTGDYFSTLKMPLLAGRTFDTRDRLSSGKVAIISQAAAKRFFAGADPIGKQFHMPSRKDEGPPYEVIGVVADSKYSSVKEDTRALIYLSVTQSPTMMGAWNYALRTTVNARDVVPQVKALARQINPQISLSYRTLDDLVASSITRERLLATLSAFFGALALLLAMIGLYGTMSYSVQRRRSEIGVRLALGAARGRVLRMVLSEVARLLVIGLVIGVAGAFATTRFVKSFLYGVAPNDLATFVLSIATLTAVALLAGAIPAWRAARLEPMFALRED
ncbi:MAG: ABC transporter permease [Phycisphaerae bacterium]|nr:ABC transporter permease [Gemmatimonadaceae bacterium]